MSETASSPSWLERLFRDEQRSLQRRITRWIGCQATSEDVIQDTFLRLAGLEVPETISNLPGYLARSARHAAIDRRRSPQSRLAGMEPLLPGMACPMPGPDEAAEHRERVRRFAAALDALPEQQRGIVVAARVEGLSYAAISARYGMSVAAVEKAVARALAQIRTTMDEA